jgi:multimeric flavodoxin WrbA
VSPVDLFGGFFCNVKVKLWKLSLSKTEMTMKRLLGVGCGRRMGNSEILLKESMMAAEEKGRIEGEYIHLHDLSLNPCTGCESCTRSLSKGGTSECWQKDDMVFLKQKFSECDALILSAPVFELRPPGLYCIMSDRFFGFGPAYLMDVFKRPARPGALISVGGSDWVQLGLPQMGLALFMLNFKVVDQMQEMWAARQGHTLFHEDTVARAHKLGESVAEALTKDPNEMEFVAEDKGMCPFCHSNLLLTRGGNIVECPICAIRGNLDMEGTKIRVNWNPDDIEKIKWRPYGRGVHYKRIMDLHVFFEQNKEKLKPQLERYRNYKDYSKPTKVKGEADRS